MSRRRRPSLPAGVQRPTIAEPRPRSGDKATIELNFEGEWSMTSEGALPGDVLRALARMVQRLGVDMDFKSNRIEGVPVVTIKFSNINMDLSVAP